ncbi:MAG: hypothetical protein ACK5OU_10435, partial [Dolichospermum sp.]
IELGLLRYISFKRLVLWSFTKIGVLALFLSPSLVHYCIENTTILGNLILIDTNKFLSCHQSVN